MTRGIIPREEGVSRGVTGPAQIIIVGAAGTDGVGAAAAGERVFGTLVSVVAVAHLDELELLVFQHTSKSSGAAVCQPFPFKRGLTEDAAERSRKEFLVKIRKNNLAAALRDVAAVQSAVNQAQRRAGGAGGGFGVGDNAVVIGIAAVLDHLVALRLTRELQAEVERPSGRRAAVPHRVGIARFIQRLVEDAVAVLAVVGVIVRVGVAL